MEKNNLFFGALMLLSSAIFSQTLSDAIKQTDNEQFETADATFKSLIQSQPNNGENYFYYGENYFKNDNLEMAKTTYQKGIDANATNPLCYVGLGKVQWYQNKAAEAKANFYKAITLAAGKNATVLMEIADAYIKAETKDINEAIKLLDMAIKLEPKNPEAFILKGDAYLEQNDGTKAIENYEKAGVLDSKSVTAILRQGQLWFRAKNYDLALDLYKQASLIDSSFAPAYREKAEIYFLAGRYANAVAQYKRYLQLNNNCSARGRYAGFLNQAKQYKESIEAADEALKCNLSNPYLYRYKGYSQFETGDYINGLQTMNTFFDMASKNAKVKIISQDYEYRGRLYSKDTKDSTSLILAIADYKKALELDSTKKDLNGDIANTYFKMKKYPEAIATYKSKMENGKPNANDYFGIGRAYYYSKDFTNADFYFDQIIKSQPDLPLGYLWKAKTSVQLYPKNETWLAKPYYEQYIAKVKPTDTEKNKKDLMDAYTYIGVYYMHNKDNCTAKTFFKKVTELDSANTNAKKFLDSAEAKKCP
jgi:tetratricopeptide (TPR) repeat protein